MFVKGSVGMGELVSRNALYMAWTVQALQGKQGPKYIGVQAAVKPSILPNIARTVSKLVSCGPCIMSVTGTASLKSKLELSVGTENEIQFNPFIFLSMNALHLSNI